jgi:hypothetical protein
MGAVATIAREADLQSGGSGMHAHVLDDFKDQLMIVLLKRLVDKNGEFSVPVAEIDSTGQYLVYFGVIGDAFSFQVRKKS